MAGLLPECRHRPRLAALALLLAFLPTLLFMGHSLSLSGEGGTADAAAHQAAGHDHDHHARHCHADFASCADQPATSGTIQLSLVDESAVADRLNLTPLPLPFERMPAGFVVRIPSPPPRSVA